MKRFVLSLISCVCAAALLLCGCATTGGGTSSTYEDEPPVSSEEPAPAHVGFYNNLTGLYELDSKDKESARPLAVMINNIQVAQKVQSGLSSASVVYETMVEGGITRLLAVFKDPSKIGKLGSLRSARYSFVDLACGHDAVYIHCGRDGTYTLPYMEDQLKLDHYDLNTGSGSKYSFRVDNGLAWEHRLFTNGELLAKAMKDSNHRMTVDDKHSDSWLNFAEEDDVVLPKGDKAKKVSVFFSASYVSNFEYDSETGLYLKSNFARPNVDNETGEQYSFKNVFVLFTTIGNFADNYRVYSELKSGEGYYICNGACQPIRWTKGGTYDSFKFTDADGKELTVNAGNSYVCITSNSNRSRTTIEGDASANGEGND